jgi:4-carboxymuconolactone decarboxylase
MKSLKFFLVLAILVSGVSTRLKAQPVMSNTQTLETRHQHITTIAAFTAKGDLERLKVSLNEGLNAGLSINEIKEVLVHLYAYCGFPRSLQGINTFIAVLDARKAKGITDIVGKEATPVKSTETRYQQGKQVLGTLTGRPETGPKTGYAAFSPEIEVFLKEHLFADLFTRDVISFTDREVATISALINLGGLEPMMRSHMSIALNLGLTQNQLQGMLSLTEAKVGKKEADAGRAVLKALLNENK